MRIMIFGRSGSGKSTYAIKLSNKLNIPVYHLDSIFFVNGWVERDKSEFITLQNNWINNQNWIIDGNSIKTLELRYSKADICIYFNFNKYLCIYRLFKRFFYKDPLIKDRAKGAKERVTLKLITYSFNFDKRVKEEIKELKAKYPKVKFFEVNCEEDLRVLTKAISVKSLYY